MSFNFKNRLGSFSWWARRGKKQDWLSAARPRLAGGAQSNADAPGGARIRKPGPDR
jgi:hypothetical protein